MRNLPLPHGTHAETASLELPFIGFCSVSVSVGSFPAPPSGHPPVLMVRARSFVVSSDVVQLVRTLPFNVRIPHCHGQFPPLFDGTH